MKSLSKSEVTEEVELNGEATAFVTAVSRILLRLGIYVSPGTEHKRIIVYVRDGKRFLEIDSLFYDYSRKGAGPPPFWSSSKEAVSYPFWWKVASHGNHMETREEAKEHLQMLGFDPNIVDHVFPPMEKERKRADCKS